MIAATTTNSCLLTIILNINSLNVPAFNTVDINDIISAVIVFCNCYCLMNRKNQLVVIVNMNEKSKVIYPQESDFSSNIKNKSFIPVFHELSTILMTTIIQSIKDEVQYTNTALTSSSINNNGNLSQAFSIALCIINKQKKTKPIQSRILVIQFDKDKFLNYNAIMNSIFSAQKLEVLVDALVLSNFDSHILQQACFLSGGIYMKHLDHKDLLQLLTTYYIADNESRNLFSLPIQKTVDFKASCFCHKRPVEFAYMCSVCLTLVCEETDRCIVCDTPSRINENSNISKT